MNVNENEILESLVVSVAQAVRCDREQINVDFSIMATGIQSIQAILIFSRIVKEFEVNVSLTELFSAPSLRDVARKIHNLVDQARVCKATFI